MGNYRLFKKKTAPSSVVCLFVASTLRRHILKIDVLELDFRKIKPENMVSEMFSVI